MTRLRSGWILALAASAALAALPSCRKEEKADAEGKTASSDSTPAAAEPAKAPAVEPPMELPAAAPEGQARTVEVLVDEKGYHPAKAPARAGEKLVLAFTRTEESECVAQVIVQDKLTDLPMNKRVEIPVTMPADGELLFTCGMKMFEGRVSVVPTK